MNKICVQKSCKLAVLWQLINKYKIPFSKSKGSIKFNQFLGSERYLIGQNLSITVYLEIAKLFSNVWVPPLALAISETNELTEATAAWETESRGAGKENVDCVVKRIPLC